MDPASGFLHEKKKDRAGIWAFLREVSYYIFGKKSSLKILSGTEILPKNIPSQAELCFTFETCNCTCTISLTAAVEHVMSQLNCSK